MKNITNFQLKVFKTVCKIPFGQTRSYKWVACQIGMPKAARAIGQALKNNPHTIVIPCHRVITSNGTIGGYSKGVAFKKKLIALEKRLLTQEQ